MNFTLVFVGGKFSNRWECYCTAV